MAKHTENVGGSEDKKSIIDYIKEDRYVLIMAVAILIFIASSSLAIISSPGEIISPVPSVSVNVESGVVYLNWLPSKTDSVSSYDIYRSSEEGALGIKVSSVPSKKLSYAERVSPGTYYYTIRASTGQEDDGNTRQVKVVVLEIVPTKISVKINNGEQYSSSQTVTLHLSAQDARECRYKNDEDLDWSAWEPFRTEKTWTLSGGGDGERIVAYQCRNTGESEIALASVKLDKTAPVVVYFLTALIGEVQMNIVVKDVISPTVSCTINRDNVEEKVDINLSSGTGYYVYKKQMTSGQHTFGLKCTDEAGNVKEIPLQTITVK